MSFGLFESRYISKTVSSARDCRLVNDMLSIFWRHLMDQKRKQLHYKKNEHHNIWILFSLKSLKEAWKLQMLLGLFQHAQYPLFTSKNRSGGGERKECWYSNSWSILEWTTICWHTLNSNTLVCTQGCVVRILATTSIISTPVCIFLSMTHPFPHPPTPPRPNPSGALK